MKHLVIIIWILLLFVACKAPAKLTDTSKVEVHDNSQINIEQRNDIQAESTTTTITSIDENATIVEETTTVEYDSDKPIDTTTGKPPIKSETTRRKTTAIGKQQQEQTQASANTNESSVLIDKTKKDIEVSTETSHIIVPKTSKIAYIFYIVLIIGIVVAGCFLNRKFKWLNKLLQ